MHYVVNNTLKLFVQFSWTMVDAFPRSIGQPVTYHPFFIAHDHHILLWETLNSSTKCSLCHLMWACVRIGKALIPRETHPFCLRFTQNQMFYLAPGLTVVTAGCSLIRKPASRIEDDHLWCPFPRVCSILMLPELIFDTHRVWVVTARNEHCSSCLLIGQMTPVLASDWPLMWGVKMAVTPAQGN